MTIRIYTSDPTTLTGAAVVQGNQVPPLTNRVIKAATLVNPTGGAVAATVHLVPNAGAVGTGNALIIGRAIAPGESYPCPELIGQAVGAGGSIQALGAGLTFKYTATDFV